MITAGRGTSPGILVGCCLFSVGTTCLYPGVFTQIGRITRSLVNKFFMLRNLLRQQTPLVLFPTVFFPPSRHCQRHAIVTIQRACRLDHSASPAQSAVLVVYEDHAYFRKIFLDVGSNCTSSPRTEAFGDEIWSCFSCSPIFRYSS